MIDLDALRGIAAWMQEQPIAITRGAYTRLGSGRRLMDALTTHCDQCEWVTHPDADELVRACPEHQEDE